MLGPPLWWLHAGRSMTLGPTCTPPEQTQVGVAQCGDEPPSSTVECAQSLNGLWCHTPTVPPLSCDNMTWLWTCKYRHYSEAAEASDVYRLLCYDVGKRGLHLLQQVQ
jgi:hypothetical protein